MATVIVDLSMSLDGFITGPNPDKEHGLGTGSGEKLHGWYFSGETPNPHNDFINEGEGSETVVEEMFTQTGAIVVGRKWYDIVNGWEGNHPIRGAEMFVVTHKPPENPPQGEAKMTFVTDGVESAVKQAKAVAGDKLVSVGGAKIAQQCLKAGLLDEIRVHLVPVVLGGGVRLFENLGAEQFEFEIAEVIDAKGVTHLRYRVVK